MEDSAGAFRRATGRDLESDGGKPRYLRYQYELIAPHCGRSVLEVGAGQGEFAAQFTGLERLVVTDLDPGALAVMEQRFAGRPEVEVRQFDIDAAEPLERPVESVVAINVLEHVDDDANALRLLARSIVPGGTLVLWVPGYQQLYGDFDHLVGHVRRYSPATLRDAVQRAGLGVRLARPVNLLGGVMWWLAVRRGGTRTPDRRLVAIYDRVVVPLTCAVERLVRVPFGQSVLCVAETPPDDG